MSTVHLKVEQQIELIRSWNLQPDFIINIKVVLDFCHFFISVELFSLRSFVYWLPNYAHVGLCQSRKIILRRKQMMHLPFLNLLHHIIVSYFFVYNFQL